jgi:TonB-linked SusC/RagA family outer membrane protein
MDEIFRAAYYQRHSLALNYNTDKVKNRLSASYSNNNGVLLGAWDDQIQIRYVGEYNINKWVKITEDFVLKTANSRSVNTSGRTDGAILSAVYMPSSAEAYKADGSFGGTTTEDPAYISQYGSNFSDIYGDVISPLRILLGTKNVNESTNIWTTTGLEIHDIVKGLKFNSRFTYNNSQNFKKSFTPRRLEVGKPNDSNSLSYSTNKDYRWKTENTLTYDRVFGKHTVGALLATTADHYYARSFTVSGKDFADEDPNLQYIDYAAALSAGDGYGGDDSNVAIVARGAYSYNDRYFVTVSWRRDYASRLPAGQKYGDFPAATAAWKISNENFFPKTVVSLLKIRASWGRIGNLGSIGQNYSAATLSKGDRGNDIAGFGAEAKTPMNEYVYHNKAINPFLTWETSQQLDLGIDFNMFNDRLSTTFDVYDKLTYNLIQGQSMGWTDSVGFDAQKVNQGSIRNRGFEATINWSDKVGNWSYYVNANYSFNKNTVEDIGIKDANGDPGVWTSMNDFGAINNFYQTREGGEVKSFHLVECAGIFQDWNEVYAHQKDGKLIQPYAQPGDLKFVDYNDDGKIDNGDRQYWGNWMPHSNFALSAGFNWKGLYASMMLQGIAGAKALYVAKQYLYNDGSGNFNRIDKALDAWTPENKDSNIPRLTRSDLNGNYSTTSTWYLEDSSYLRLKNITVGYDFTDLLRKSRHFKERSSRIQVYFSGENLYTFTKYSGMDPEVNGYDPCKFPVSRVLSLGMKLTY